MSSLERIPLAGLAVVLLSCGPTTVHQPPAGTLTTLAEVRKTTPPESVIVVIQGGIVLPNQHLDSLPGTEVVSALWATVEDRRDLGRKSCQGLIVQLCGSPKVESSKDCPWALPVRKP